MWAKETTAFTFCDVHRLGCRAPVVSWPSLLAAGPPQRRPPLGGLSQCSAAGWQRELPLRPRADVSPVLAVSNRRPTARRKPDYEPVENTDEAQKKFGNVKAISSDMYFGRQAQAEVSVGKFLPGGVGAGGGRCVGGWEAPGPGERGEDPHPGLSEQPPHCAAPVGAWPGGRGLSPLCLLLRPR